MNNEFAEIINFVSGFQTNVGLKMVCVGYVCVVKAYCRPFRVVLNCSY